MSVQRKRYSSEEKTKVNHKHAARLLRQMGLMALYPRPRLSQPGEPIVLYPYLLRRLTIDRTNQVWSTDITYIRLRGGFLYLVAIIGWFSSYVPSLANLHHFGDRLLSGST